MTNEEKQKIREDFQKFNHLGSLVAIEDYFISLIESRENALLKEIKKIKNRDNTGAFRHIEVYKDDILSLISSKI